jgi:hypothetical protein
MKFRTIIFPALAVMACSPAVMPVHAVAGDADQAVVIKVADQDVVLPAPRVRRSHRYLVPRPYYPRPLACESVLFPRSPACAGRPASFGFYATYPWNHYWSE